MQEISWSDFEKIMLVAGTIKRVEPFPEARKPAYKVWVDFGPYGERKTSAQITRLYTVEDLIGRQIIGVINFPEKQIGPFRSQFLLSGFETEAGVVLSALERPVPNGTRLS
ncbi:chaperone [Acetobacter indonesiensis NRIC 0313]|jgi:tRNA-binding protein|uniref:Chaperone CsaA export-related n=1 Tax=Acetobacter indonesiensis TaxID=104101 RepID=A0A6N3T853_9PROT|nr:tRNA-binding protein [Acetobacter indonesiensis]MCG0995164.1 tRNA-binding protein [Acetobacter indonesiensis]MCI1437210.1 tRNA-binding protein [Acetobacter indonesiensis]MCI1546294.1 tRNA-binding protein [Acetobacter indonesiensis]MCI1765716.1 tRNA-binding protein [Acetobacter indonesiensis]MCP1230979.1 tRNA-binding protein [Acetobacter indonesiensis]